MERRVILASYGDELARKFGRANRRKISEYGGEIFDMEIQQGNSSVTNWGIAGTEAGMLSGGIRSGITGEGANLLIVDDPIKNHKEANSESFRESVWNEWQNTLLTRLHPGGAIIIILTRWHEDDLAGRILKEAEPGEWHVVKLPALAEENDLLGRAPGEPLWPDHGYGLAWAEKQKKEVGSYAWNALYQQRPSPQEGGVWKRSWWKYYTKRPNHFDEIIQSWDCAFKDTDTSSYVVGQVWGRIGADKYLLDQVRDRMDFVTTVKSIKSLTAAHPQAYAKLIEDKANGSAVISLLSSTISGLIPVTPDGGKLSRAQAAAPDIEAGNVYIPEPTIAPWVHDFVEEAAAFPFGANDDQVDCASQAINRLRMAPELRTGSLGLSNW